MRYVGYALLALLAALVVCLVIAVVRALLMPSKVSVYRAPEAGDRAFGYAEKLARMVQYDTTSYAEKPDPERYRGFHQVLQELFPLVFDRLEKTEIGEESVCQTKKSRATTKRKRRYLLR